jgi:hypothetical protein
MGCRVVAAAPELLTPRWKVLRPHATQHALWSSEALYNVAEAGRRSGKSELAKRKGVKLALTHHRRSEFTGGHYKFGAPTRDQAKHIYWEDLKLLVPSRFVNRISESELWIELIDGTRLWVVGLDASKRIEGQPMDWFFGDEAQEWQTGVWDRTVWPALQDRNGGAWIYGVPRPGAEFEELAKRAKSGSPGWAYFKWKSEDILGRDRLAFARAKMDSRIYAQEFEASRVSMEGRIYQPFEREIHAREPLAHLYDRGLPLEICLDFNRSPGVAELCQQVRFRRPERPRDDRPEVADVIDAFLGEVHIPRASDTPLICREIIQRWGDHEGPVVLYGDPTGGNKGTAKVAGSDWDIVERDLGRHFGANRVELRVRRKTFPERTRINPLNARFRDTDGLVRCLVDPEKCPYLCDDLEQVTTKPGTSGEIDKDRDKTKTHGSDAVSYRAEYEFGFDSTILLSEELR